MSAVNKCELFSHLQRLRSKHLAPSSRLFTILQGPKCSERPCFMRLNLTMDIEKMPAFVYISKF